MDGIRSGFFSIYKGVHGNTRIWKIGGQVSLAIDSHGLGCTLTKLQRGLASNTRQYDAADGSGCPRLLRSASSR